MFQQVKEKIPRKTVEVTNLRTANSKTYLKLDGKTYVTETYLEPIHYRKNGKWQPIDNQLQSKAMDSDHAYTNTANEFQVGFAKSTETRELGKFQVGRNSLSFGPVETLNSTAVVKGDQITYPNIYAGVDLVYTVTSTGVKEVWNIKKKSDRSTFSTELHLSHLQPKENKDGSISLVDDKDNVVSVIPKPIVTDAKGASPTSLQYKIRTEKGQTFLDTLVDSKWLSDPKRSYPDCSRSYAYHTRC